MGIDDGHDHEHGSTSTPDNVRDLAGAVARPHCKRAARWAVASLSCRAAGEERLNAIALSRLTTPRSSACSRSSSRPRSGASSPAELFATIKGELTLHEIVEEEIFYPELKAHPKAKDIVLEDYEEHHVVDVLMGELEALDVSDERGAPRPWS